MRDFILEHERGRFHHCPTNSLLMVVLKGFKENGKIIFKPVPTHNRGGREILTYLKKKYGSISENAGTPKEIEANQKGR